jgi:DNA-binding MarR family transcriptional regulator
MASVRHKGRAKVKGCPRIVLDIPVDARKHCGITPREVYALRSITELQDPRVCDLGAHMQRSNISNLVSGLVRRGYITRHVLADDMRAHILRLTPKGKEALRSI